MPQVSQQGSGVRGKVPNSQSFPELSNIYPLSQHLSSEKEPEPDLSSKRAGACRPHAHWLLACSQSVFHSTASVAEKSHHWMLNLQQALFPWTWDSAPRPPPPQYFIAFQPQCDSQNLSISGNVRVILFHLNAT